MTSTHSLHFMCGKAGSGKSVLARALAEAHEALLVCEDVWLARLYPTELVTFDDYIRCSRRIRTVVGPMVVDALRRQSVVLDFPGNTVDTRAWFRSLFESAGAAHSLHYLVASDQRCLQQIAQRNLERPEGSHEISEEMFHYISSFFQPPTETEGFNMVTYT